MNNIYWIALNIVLLMAVKAFAQEPQLSAVNSMKGDKYSLSSILEDIRNKDGVNFIYSDNVIKDIRVNYKIAGDLNRKELKNFLSQFGLSCKSFGSGNIVIFKNETVPIKSYGRVNIKNIFYKDTGDVKDPRLISNIIPVYPQLAVIRKIEGKVKIRFLVTKDGDVSKIIVDSTSGSELLDRATVEYVSKLKFIPAVFNGKFQKIWMSKLFDYYLREKK